MLSLFMYALFVMFNIAPPFHIVIVTRALCQVVLQNVCHSIPSAVPNSLTYQHPHTCCQWFPKKIMMESNTDNFGHVNHT